MSLYKPAVFWPLTIDATNDKVDSQVGATVKASTLTHGIYYSPVALLLELQSQLNTDWTAAGYNHWAVGLSSTGFFSVLNSTDASTYKLLFSTGANAANSCRSVFGFGANDFVWVGPSASVGGWYQHLNGFYAPDPVISDTGELFRKKVAQTVALSGKVKTLTYPTTYLRTVAFDFLPENKTFVADELEISTAQIPNQAIERWIRDGFARFRYFDDQTLVGSVSGPTTGIADYVLDIESMKEMPWNRKSPGLAQYAVTVMMRPYV